MTLRAPTGPRHGTHASLHGQGLPRNVGLLHVCLGQLWASQWLKEHKIILPKCLMGTLRLLAKQLGSCDRNYFWIRAWASGSNDQATISLSMCPVAPTVSQSSARTAQAPWRVSDVGFHGAVSNWSPDSCSNCWNLGHFWIPEETRIHIRLRV